jgi:hypothetical protein
MVTTAVGLIVFACVYAPANPTVVATFASARFRSPARSF